MFVTSESSESGRQARHMRRYGQMDARCVGSKRLSSSKVPRGEAHRPMSCPRMHNSKCDYCSEVCVDCKLPPARSPTTALVFSEGKKKRAATGRPFWVPLFSPPPPINYGSQYSMYTPYPCRLAPCARVHRNQVMESCDHVGAYRTYLQYITDLFVRS